MLYNKDAPLQKLIVIGQIHRLQEAYYRCWAVIPLHWLFIQIQTQMAFSTPNQINQLNHVEEVNAYQIVCKLFGVQTWLLTPILLEIIPKMKSIRHSKPPTP